MKTDKFYSLMLGALIVLISISVYNVNAVLSGVTPGYFKGLLLVFAISVAVSSLFVSIVGKTRKSA